MSVSIDSSEPVLEYGFQHGELLSAAYDAHGGVRVNIKKPMDPKVFDTALRASLLQWRKQGKESVWLQLPIGLADLTETAEKEGFRLNHSEPDYEVYFHRFLETPSTIPANATNRVGIKREASDVMSVSIDSSVPVHEDGFQQGELNSESYDDFGGVEMNIRKPIDPEVFHTALKASLLQWRKLGKWVVWLRLPISLGDLTETAEKEGFRLIRTEPHYMVYVHWIREILSTIPVKATHRVGIEREMGGPTEELIREKMEVILRIMGSLVRQATTLEEKRSYQMKDIRRLKDMCWMLRKIRNWGIDIYFNGHLFAGLSLRPIYEELLAKYPNPFLEMEAPTRKPMEFWKWFSAAAILKRKFERLYSSLEELFSAGSTSFDRKWEELDKDCLVEVFQKVGIEPLLFATTYVCKTWHEASLDPMCWEPHFPEHLVFSKTGSMEFIVDRCTRLATSIMLSRTSCLFKDWIHGVHSRSMHPSCYLNYAVQALPLRGDRVRR